ncbi:MAG: winged helix-turn-helix domain-containing protein, partial [Myxococcota bacterium]
MRDPAISNSDEPASLYRIGDAELDTKQRQLRFSGVAAEVQPKVFDLLAYLVQHRDRVVSKDELFDQVWPSVVVSDASLSQTIKRARDHFRAAGFENDVIRTVPRTGYQFDHPLTVVDGAPPETIETSERVDVIQAPSAIEAATPEPNRRLPATRILLVAAVLLSLLAVYWRATKHAPTVEPEASSAAANAVAVLPFTNLTPDPDFVYFTDGVTETLINNLATVPGLRVIARTSTYRAAESGQDLTAIAKSLNVGHILTGSVQRDGNVLRIGTRLLLASDGTQLWSHQYSRMLDDIFAVQDDIARATVAEISKRVAVDLSAPKSPAVAETAATAKAYRLVLQGNRLRRKARKQSVLEAETLFREALDIAPDYAPALVQLAEVLRFRGTTGSLPRERAFRESLTRVQKAVRIAPNNGQAHMQMAELLHRHLWDFDAAQVAYDRALELMPASGDVYSAYSRFLAKAGRRTEAGIAAKSAAEMDPQSANVLTNLVLRLIKAGELQDARAAIERLRALDANHVDLPWLETNWHLRAGDERQALRWIAEEELYYLRLSLSAVALHRLGRTGQADDALRELIERDAEGSAFQIAEVYAQWGNIDDA